MTDDETRTCLDCDGQFTLTAVRGCLEWQGRRLRRLTSESATMTLPYFREAR